MDRNSDDDNTIPVEEDNNGVCPQEERLTPGEEEASGSTIDMSEDEIGSENEASGEVTIADVDNPIKEENRTLKDIGIVKSEKGGMEDADSDEKQSHRNKDGPTVPAPLISQGGSGNKFLLDLVMFQLLLLTSLDDKVYRLVISKRASIRELYENACSLLKLDHRRVRISANCGHNKVYLSQLSPQILENIPLHSDQAIFVEMKLEGDSMTESTEGISPVLPVNLLSDEDDTLWPVEGANKVLTGLHNLGNTCFMNSAIQCLGHTAPVFDYFTQDFDADINKQNPLGNKGELAIAFGNLLRKLCSSQDFTVAPRRFKKKIADFAPQFGGANQQDSHEFLAFLLDGLHEDLNRVKEKPYVERKDANDRPDEEVATEYWENHKARNDSVIVDVFQGQEKSTLACPVCRKVSVTFDPFMCLSLPVPLPAMRQITVNVIYCDGSAPPSHYTVNVPRDGSCYDLIRSLGSQCMLRRGEENLILAEVHHHEIHQSFEPYQKLSEINDNALLLAYRLPAHEANSPKLLIYHRDIGPRKNRTRFENTYNRKQKNRRYDLRQRKGGYSQHQNKPMYRGAPLFTYLPHRPTLQNVLAAVRRVLQPLFRNNRYNQLYPFEGYTLDNMDPEEICDDDLHHEFRLLDPGFGANIFRGELDWSADISNLYDRRHIDGLPAVNMEDSRRKIPLFECFEAFLKEEPLGHDNMWYCSTCKEQREATKKLDLWRLGEILCIQLKRFSSDGYKIKAIVDFPVRGLDLNKYVKGENYVQNHVYDLYAIINHGGNLNRGHYTAFAKRMESDTWYRFDDGKVNVVDENSIHVAEAYILFYKRVAVDVEGSRIKDQVQIKEV